MIGFIDTYTFTQFVTTGNYSAIYILHTFSSQLQTLAFSRILATASSQSHCQFNSHTLSPWHSLIPSLAFPTAAYSEDFRPLPCTPTASELPILIL
jgi:hypothetical protein